MVIVLFGVTGSGKTTVGRLLANELGWQFVDADDHHPADNIAKMAAGMPLNDDDRKEWLESLRQIFAEAAANRGDIVLACSALKSSYREYLAAGDNVKFVLLETDEETIRQRHTSRMGHFMPASLIQSQFDTLETADRIDLSIDSTLPPDYCVKTIQQMLATEWRSSSSA